VTSVRLTTCGPPVQTERISLCCLIANVSVAGAVVFSKRSRDGSVFEIKASVGGASLLAWPRRTSGTYMYGASLTGANAVRNFSITSLNRLDTLQNHGGEIWKCGFYDYFVHEHVSQLYTIPQTRKHYFYFQTQTKCVFSLHVFVF